MTTSFPFQLRDGIGTIFLTPEKPHQPPTFDLMSLAALDAALADAEAAIARFELRILFLRSTSERFFCAGANIAALRELRAGTIDTWIETGHRVFARLEDLPVPTVARVEGFALGGGLELALACDLIVAGESARFGQTEARLGFVTGWGGSARLPYRIGRSRAKELLFSARIIAGRDANARGLVDFCGTGEELHEYCQKLAADVRAGSPISHREHKRLLRRSDPSWRETTRVAETTSSKTCLAADDTQARVEAFLQRGR